jgi:hypothetical protein
LRPRPARPPRLEHRLQSRRVDEMSDRLQSLRELLRIHAASAGGRPAKNSS